MGNRNPTYPLKLSAGHQEVSEGEIEVSGMPDYDFNLLYLVPILVTILAGVFIVVLALGSAHW